MMMYDDILSQSINNLDPFTGRSMAGSSGQLCALGTSETEWRENAIIMDQSIDLLVYQSIDCTFHHSDVIHPFSFSTGTNIFPRLSFRLSMLVLFEDN